jgi:hypothetical protein
MPPADQPPDQHQVGVTNAQEHNPDAVIADLTRRMNAHFAAGEFGEAAVLALEITARSKDELRGTFVRHGVVVLHLDHEAFGIYEGKIEPTYDVHVEGQTKAVLDAAAEFGKHHAQEMILVARKLHQGERDPAERLGLTILLKAEIGLEEAVEITALVQDHGFKGATFGPKRHGAVAIYHTDNLGMTAAEFQDAATVLLAELVQAYPALQFDVQKYLIHMPRL